MQYKPHCFVFTGGPGAGKTAVLEQLQQQGYHTIPEVARDIIREQMARNGEALPWKNTRLYKQIMADRTIDAYHHAPDEGTCFFDRGIADVIAYGQLINAPIDDALHQAALTYRYNRMVFLFPPWKEIYTTDTERKQDFEEAIATYNTIKSTYLEYNYELIEMPLVSVAERLTFIINHTLKKHPE